MMEEKRSEEREARSASRSLPPAELAELTSRAAALGVRVNVLDDGRRIELLTPIPR